MSQLPAVIGRLAPREIEPQSSPIVRIQRAIFADALSAGASDIHIEPGRESTRIRCRIDGQLRETMELPRWTHDSLIVRIKVLANLDIAERRVPQDGHIGNTAADLPEGIDLRVSTLPTRWGEKAVLRLLRRERSVMTVSQMGFPPSCEETLHALIRRPQGILLVVGPTGSGKTTTLYSLLHELRGEPLNIVTIEDPVEYEVDGIAQVQLQERAGLTFPRALRAILRQDPDVILLGEIRDTETAKTAFHAAMTGHLVLSTLHCPDTVSAFLRLEELGVERSLASAALLGVVAQRLVRLNCPRCVEPESPRPIYLERLGIPAHLQNRLRTSTGCSDCGFTGTRGRSGLFELLEVRGPVREASVLGDIAALRRVAMEAGMVTLGDQAARLAIDGAISVREAYRSGNPGGD